MVAPCQPFCYGVTLASHPSTCVVTYMQWFRYLSHPYILSWADGDWSYILLCCRTHSTNDGQTRPSQHEHACLVSYLHYYVLYFFVFIFKVPNALVQWMQGIFWRITDIQQCMIDYGHVTKCTITWDKTDSALQLARDITNERIILNILRLYSTCEKNRRLELSFFIKN